jgi:hypothetical protein
MTSSNRQIRPAAWRYAQAVSVMLGARDAGDWAVWHAADRVARAVLAGTAVDRADIEMVELSRD